MVERHRAVVVADHLLVTMTRDDIDDPDIDFENFFAQHERRDQKRRDDERTAAYRELLVRMAVTVRTAADALQAVATQIQRGEPLDARHVEPLISLQ
ncbi:hypothetical protein, partial [Gemmatimonas sp.]|uniref:hypothetical protein n=1 Tax=Gemmatimonas sp. TaxID=1962908 RepID=UPI003982E8B7